MTNNSYNEKFVNSNSYELKEVENIEEVYDEIEELKNNELEEDFIDEINIDDKEYDDIDEDDYCDEDDDLLIVKENKRIAKLPEGEYAAIVEGIMGEHMIGGEYGPWIKITIPFIIKNPSTDEKVIIPFIANKSLDKKSRLYPIVKGILGAEPGKNFDLRNLEGIKAIVSIKHNADSDGNVWDNIVVTRKLD